MPKQNKTKDKIAPIKQEEIKENLKELHNKISLEEIKKIDSSRDIKTKQSKNLINKIYNFWVYIVKDGELIKSFGVREEIINGIKLLVRTEKINGEIKVVFRELLPEPKFDIQIIEQNKKRILEKLNLLKQIEKELEDEIYLKGKSEEHNYDLSDVKISILQKEIELNSIKYGKSFRYVHKWIREDGIPALVYEFENNGLRLKKEVKESSLFTEASEIKQIESLETKREIDETLKRTDSRDWKKWAYSLLFLIFTLVYIYGAFELLDYNHERENKEIHDQLKATITTYNQGVKSIVTKCGENTDPLIKRIDELIQNNNNLMESCIMKNNLGVDNSRPRITE